MASSFFVYEFHLEPVTRGSFQIFNTVFKFSVSWFKKSSVELMFFALVMRFRNVPIFHSDGACEYQLM